jgi:branched-chain amino acid transport system permease protein
VAATVAALAYLVLVVPNQNGAIIFLFENAVIAALFALATNLLVGQAGIVCFGEAVFFGIGAYVVSVITEHHSWDAVPLVCAGAASGAVAALVVGLITIRVYGIALAMFTLALGQICFLWFSTSNAVGGENGIVVLAPAKAAGVDITSQTSLYYFIVAMVLLAMAVLFWIYRSPFGLVLRVMREDHVRTRYLGINPAAIKVLAFVISGAAAGWAGALSAMATQIITPDLFNWTNSGSPVLMSALGGFNSFAGPIIGAGIYSWLSNHFSGGAVDPNLILGAILLVVVLVVPRGLVSLGDTIQAVRARRSLRTRGGPRE